MQSEQQDSTGHARIPRYLGEDTRPTSKKELWGWYSYGWAAEVFVVCGIGTHICPLVFLDLGS